jgi:hypothetical protein
MRHPGAEKTFGNSYKGRHDPLIETDLSHLNHDSTNFLKKSIPIALSGMTGSSSGESLDPSP